MVYREALMKGENIIVSKIGDDAKELAESIENLHELGYSVFLHLNELHSNKSMARAIGRYAQSDGTFGR